MYIIYFQHLFELSWSTYTMPFISMDVYVHIIHIMHYAAIIHAYLKCYIVNLYKLVQHVIRATDLTSRNQFYHKSLAEKAFI
jgi:hypothetical protein